MLITSHFFRSFVFSSILFPQIFNRVLACLSFGSFFVRKVPLLNSIVLSLNWALLCVCTSLSISIQADASPFCHLTTTYINIFLLIRIGFQASEMGTFFRLLFIRFFFLFHFIIMCIFLFVSFWIPIATFEKEMTKKCKNNERETILITIAHQRCYHHHTSFSSVRLLDSCMRVVFPVALFFLLGKTKSLILVCLTFIHLFSIFYPLHV